MEPQSDYIIVGQGLAGSVLALQLLWEGKNVIVIDEPSLSSSSKIAPGIFNPLVFKRMVKSWMADEALERADIFYTRAEAFLGNSFYHKKQIVKFFTEEQEKQLWIKKTKEEVGRYLSKEIFDQAFSPAVKKEGGYAFVNGTGNLNTANFLNCTRDHLIKSKQFIEEEFDYSKIVFKKKEIVSYKDNTATKIIFCEGYKVKDNPYFNGLPMKPTKGEVLTLEIPGLNLEDQILIKGIFIAPIEKDIYKVGSTFNWKDISETPTTEGKREITDKLKELISLPFKILDHQAGIRPTVAHRRPLLGLHPQHPQLAVFNGLGTKGVMLAPLCADRFSRLLKGEEIEKEFVLFPMNEWKKE